MTQIKLRLNNNKKEKRDTPEFAEAIGLSCEDEVITLRFIGDAHWGQRTRQVRLDKSLAEQLSRLLNDELSDGYPDFAQYNFDNA